MVLVLVALSIAITGLRAGSGIGISLAYGI